jgi:hypothetical protein
MAHQLNLAKTVDLLVKIAGDLVETLRGIESRSDQILWQSPVSGYFPEEHDIQVEPLANCSGRGRETRFETGREPRTRRYRPFGAEATNNRRDLPECQQCTH